MVLAGTTTFILLKIVNRLVGLCVSEEDESVGLNLSQRGWWRGRQLRQRAPCRTLSRHAPRRALLRGLCEVGRLPGSSPRSMGARARRSRRPRAPMTCGPVHRAAWRVQPSSTPFGLTTRMSCRCREATGASLAELHSTTEGLAAVRSIRRSRHACCLSDFIFVPA